MWNKGLNTMDDCIAGCRIAQQHVARKVAGKPLLVFRAGDTGNTAPRFQLVVCTDAAKPPLMKKNAPIKISLRNEWKNLSLSQAAYGEFLVSVRRKTVNTLAREVIHMKGRG